MSNQQHFQEFCLVVTHAYCGKLCVGQVDREFRGRTGGNCRYCIKCIYCLIEKMSKSFLFSVTDLLNDSRLSHHRLGASEKSIDQ